MIMCCSTCCLNRETNVSLRFVKYSVIQEANETALHDAMTHWEAFLMSLASRYTLL